MTIACRARVSILIAAAAVVAGIGCDGFRPPLGGDLIQWESGTWRATRLADGRVLALDDAGTPEIFDPWWETFTPTGPMLTARSLYAATRLADGRVLITGGRAIDGAPLATLASTELFDPVTQTFSEGPAMTEPRLSHTATLLADGRVLIAGGSGEGGQRRSAEIYDPVDESFTPVGDMTVTHYRHAAVLLSSGQVLVAGGLHPYSSGGGARDEAELFDPVAGAFTPTGDLNTQRSSFRLTALLDGSALVTGGQSSGVLMDPVERYDPSSGEFVPTGVLADGRGTHSATRLSDGCVLIAGGYIQTDYFTTELTDRAELYDPSTDKLSDTFEPLVAPRAHHGAALLDSGRVVLVGGTRDETVDPRAELYIPAAVWP